MKKISIKSSVRYFLGGVLMFFITGIMNAQEFLIDTSLIYVPSRAYKQIEASVAFDGTNYFIVWSDSRNGSDYDIYGARISMSGTLIDTPGILISSAEGYQSEPYAIFDGTNYFVVWTDQRNGSQDIYGARVTTEGIVLDTDGILISDAINDQFFPSVAFDGTNYFVVWSDFRNGSDYDIYGARINTSGTVLDPLGIPVSSDTNAEYYPRISFDGTNYFVVWTEYTGNDSLRNDIYGVRVSPSGTVIDAQKIPVSTALYNQFCPLVSFDGANYFVVWEDERNGNYDIYGARVSPSGNLLDLDGIPISTAAGTQYSSSLTFDGTNYFVVWEDLRNGSDCDIFGTYVTTSGTVLDTEGIAISTASDDQSSPSVIFGNTEYLVVWTYWHSYPERISDIYGARVTQSGQVIDTQGIIVSNYAYSQDYPSVSFDGTNYLIVWSDYRNGSFYPDLYGIRVDGTGTIIDSTPIPISTASYGQYSPSVAFDGTNYMIVWANSTQNGSYDIYGARVNTSGVVLDPAGFPISTAGRAQVFPHIIFGDTNYFVVWEDRRNTNADIYGARVDTSGKVLDTLGIPISTQIDRESSPSVAFDGTNYFVVWEDRRNDPYYSDIYGARVTSSGVVIDTLGIPISEAVYNQEYPSLAFDGTNYFVVWQDKRNGDYDIYGTRVDLSGAVLDTSGIPISVRSRDQRHPSVVFDGRNYVVVWEDYRNGRPDIYGAYVSVSGQVLDTFTVSLQAGNQFSPSLARGTDNRVLIVYSGWTRYINGRTANTMRIWGKLLEGTEIKEISHKENDFSFLITYLKNKEIIFRFCIPEKSKISLKVYDAAGRVIMSFLNGQYSGFYKILFKPKTKGIYFYKMNTPFFIKRGKIVVF